MIITPFARGPLAFLQGVPLINIKKLLIICGPTATGKTDLALYLAKKHRGEIISADSRQVYKGMDIGTGKDLPVNSKLKTQNSKLYVKNEKFTVGYRRKSGIPVWLVDVVDPDYIFNLGEYQKLAHLVINDILLRKKLPIVIGGTGLYIKSIIEPLHLAQIPPDPHLRHKLEKISREDLASYLQKINPARWNTMNNSDRLNPRRLIRAVEIAETIQNPIEQSPDKTQNDDKLNYYDFQLIGLTSSNNVLYDRINRRVYARVKAGRMEGEIKKLFKSGYNFKNSVMGVTIGYKQWQGFMEGSESRKEAISKWQFAEHAYVRRQMTWFRKQKKIKWFDISKENYVVDIEKEVCKWYTENN